MHTEPAAQQRRDAPTASAADGVSFVMPVLNEADYLERAVQTVLDQDVAGPMELVLALGPSSDSTTQIAQRLAAADKRITLIDNPQADIPVGLNAAIKASRYPTIVRVDAHSELSPGYTARALDVLERTKAANVGGVMRASGRTPFQRAVARAYNSPIGLGGGAYHGTGQAGPAESAYLGVMRRSVVEEVGMFDESIRRGEDWELNLRIRNAGYAVWFDPTLSVTYWPREQWSRLARQFFATGTWRGELVRRFGRRNSVRFFAPPLLLLSIIAAIALGVLQLTGVVQGALSVVLSLIYLPVALYLLVLLGFAAAPGGGSLRQRLWSLLVIPTMHVSWGAGFVRGLFHGADDTIDTSRLDGRNTPLP